MVNPLLLTTQSTILVNARINPVAQETALRGIRHCRSPDLFCSSGIPAGVILPAIANLSAHFEAGKDDESSCACHFHTSLIQHLPWCLLESDNPPRKGPWVGRTGGCIQSSGHKASKAVIPPQAKAFSTNSHSSGWRQPTRPPSSFSHI